MKDYFGQDSSVLKNKKLWLFDMDGTIYNDDRIFDGTLDLLQFIKQNGGKYIFITNNSSKSVEDYIGKVTKMGICADSDNFFTSTQATVFYLKKNHPGKKVYVQATRSCVSELLKSGIDVTEEVDENADIVLVGFDRELTTKKLENTCIMLGHDNVFLATNPDFVCPVSFGYVPDCGSICQMLENATKRKPTYIGKPQPTMVNIAREKFGYSADETVVIGDRLYTDIASGVNAGVTAICVLSGEVTVDDIKRDSVKPSLTFGSVKDIYQVLLAYKNGEM